ncbi:MULTISPECIES: MarR family winged helix-turn-helix transcriptional regulator [unclassified Dietzia]|uniref:MarR family winged helix-turn-helix transcriptional regulator n=1 Tax=unclassified Dietzia TaxID=2617939 RepID=UPI000D219589|nr:MULTISPECIES: MarR family transcriptional regulator [unclassified Dietzia]AVZ39382.1 MarR family transcriptional regulator [Dietzia sp. JS16-p6b]MBB1025354.1 MarR family transcriptional regulator [Dietzia sp. DQ12-76]MBB1028897.1 MarR family transcriptional regulator [Dietzia sp. DQ11-38-2]QGW24646.1 MarR family transcriptional regulator [Dietzia sp. DQ12-45-1b]
MDADLRLDQQVCFALYAASRASTAAYREALAAVGLTYPQYLVLLALWEEDGLTLRQLGERMYLDSGTLSPLLSRMEAAGLVSRSRAGRDARSVTVSLTGPGSALREEAGRIQCALVEKLDMPPGDLVELRRLARGVVAALGRADAR